jgi:hypothetical protein
MANPVGGQLTVIVPTIVVTAGAYGANDVVGGVIELPKVFRQEGRTVVLQDVFVLDAADQDPVLEILLFDQEPEQTYTNDAAMPTLDEDIDKIVARVSVAAASYVTVGGLAAAYADDLGHPIKAAKGLSSLWAVIVVTSTPTFAAVDDLRVRFGFFQD